MFTIPQFEIWAMLYTAFGTCVFWAKWGRSKLKPFLLGTVMDYFFDSEDSKTRHLIEFVLFVASGVLIGVGLTQPHNGMQALAAGLGWTGLVASNK